MTFAGSLNVSLAITLGAGLHRDAGPAVLKRRFSAAWGKTEVFVANATGWELARLRAWRHSEHWSIRMALAHSAGYGLRLEAGSRHPYGDMRQHRLRLALGYGDLRLHRLRLRMNYGDLRPYRQRFVVGYADMAQARSRQRWVYGDLTTCQRSMRLGYWLTQQTAVRHRLGYDLRDLNPVTHRLAASWSLLSDARLQAVVNSPEMTCNGQTVRIIQATLSCDEESPFWMASVEVAELADFASIGIGQSITLALGLESFVFVVDGKTLSRQAVTQQRCELSAVSPLALLDTPFAATIRYYQSLAVSARAAVQALIGPVTWDLPDWVIAPGRLMIEGVTPLGAARNIVAAIGAIVESNPDGSVVCRRRHPVSIAQYAQAAVAHSLFDMDVISASARIAPSRGFNRVTIANEDGDGGSASPQIEYVPDAGDANQGTVRAYLSAMRPVVLTHTGHPATVIASLGSVSRSEVETVEFVQGLASTRLPVTSITSAVWQHTDLGAVSANGQALVAATAGFSLLRLTYTVTSLDWRVALSTDEEVQFVLVDT